MKIMTAVIKVLFDEVCFFWSEQERQRLLLGMVDPIVELFGFDKEELMKCIGEMV